MLKSPILELRPSTNRIETAKERDNILESKARELLNCRGISLDGDEDISQAADLILYGKRHDQVKLCDPGLKLCNLQNLEGLPG